MLSPDNAYSEQRLAERCARAEIQIDRLRTQLKQALRQWSMYAEMVENNDGFDLATEKSPEGDMYRAAHAAAFDE
jgi:hypothetical protein